MSGSFLPDLQNQRPPRSRRGRLFAGAFSLVAHGAVLFGMFLALPKIPEVAEPAPMMASLVDGSILAPDPEPAPAAPAVQAEAVKPPEPPKLKARQVAAPPKVKPILVAKKIEEEDEPPQPPAPVLTDAQIAGAATVGAGGDGSGGDGRGGGGRCDMLRLLQSKLRGDPLVQQAVGEAHRSNGKAMLVWNGDWVRSSAQDGKGLAALRQAILWEVGFAPEACKNQPVTGLVMISMSEGQGSARIVVGQGHWRWSDLLRR